MLDNAVSGQSAAPLGDDLMAPEVVLDPYTYFSALRERAPVYRNARLGAHLLTRYDDVMAAFRDPRLSADRITPYYEPRLSRPGGELHRAAYDSLSRWMVFVDPPEHTRLRKLVDRAFRPRAIERMRPNIQALVDEILQGLRGRSEFDFVHDFAYPLPVMVISEMFGVPREDRDRIKGWSDDIMTLVFGALDVPDRHERARRAFEGFGDYLSHIVKARRERPGDDLISTLVQAEERGDALSEREVVATCILLLFGGHETTTNLLANGLKNLLLFPEQLARLRADWGLLPNAIEEILRFDGPSKAMWRVATEPVEYGGQRIAAGEKVLLVQAAANRDPRKFERPDEFDITREKPQHCGFGYAVHYCIGAPIARVEGALALRALLERCPDLQLAESSFDYHPTVLNRALKRLRVRLAD